MKFQCDKKKKQKKNEIPLVLVSSVLFQVDQVGLWTNDPTLSWRAVTSCSADTSKISLSAVSPSLTEVAVAFHPWLVLLPRFKAVSFSVWVFFFFFSGDGRVKEVSVGSGQSAGPCWVIYLQLSREQTWDMILSSSLTIAHCIITSFFIRNFVNACSGPSDFRSECPTA